MLHAKRYAPGMLGNTEMEMLSSHTSSTGVEYPKGTLYTPQSFGADGNGGIQVTVAIKGEAVQFTVKRKNPTVSYPY